MTMGYVCIKSISLSFMECTCYIVEIYTCHLFGSRDCVKVYMDDFTMYGNSFKEALVNLEKKMVGCKETNVSLSNEKWFMILTKGIFLGHHVSSVGVKVDPTKIEVIMKLTIPTS